MFKILRHIYTHSLAVNAIIELNEDPAVLKTALKALKKNIEELLEEE